MPTNRECQTILFNLGLKLGVSPRLISTRLLRLDDKKSLVNGSLSIVELEANTVAWMASGMPDYAKGLTETFESEKNRAKMAEIYKENETGKVYNKPFVEYRESK
jgi:hypothetical protein